MAAREKPVPEGRPIKIKTRTTKVSNVNQSPEQHGNDRVPRIDVSLSFSCSKDDVDQILVVDGGTERLWNRELLIFPELVGWHEIDATFEGEAKIGRMNGEAETFENAILKKLLVRLDPSREIEVKAQLRVDSDGEAEFLQRIHCAGLCKFAFTGRKLVPPKAPEAGGPGQTDLVDESNKKETPANGDKPKPRRGRKVH